MRGSKRARSGAYIEVREHRSTAQGFSADEVKSSENEENKKTRTELT